MLMALCLIGLQSAQAQQLKGYCGTSLEDNALIKQRMLENREYWDGKILPRSGAITYIPVNLWLMAKDDGSGRLLPSKITEFMCCLNNSVYKDMDFQFYINKVILENRSYVFDDPSSTLGEAYIRSYMLGNKNAINIFIANIARASDPGVLAFYNPSGDYIVTNKSYINSDCSTLAHEIGHYFSLAHTFYGWENTEYFSITSNCTKPTPKLVSYAGGSVLVEYVDRNKAGTGGKKLCEQAADGFCDTPADYNLGFGYNGRGCNYDSCSVDPDGVKLDPLEVNYMSYFLDCINSFTAEQKAAILKDYLSSGRNYLRRTPEYTAKPQITEAVNYIKPTSTNLPLGYDEVVFDWDDVPEATHYLFELGENTGFTLNPKFYVLTKSDTVLRNLVKNKTYYWRITAYNSNSFCIVSKLVTFKNPNWTVASENIEDSQTQSYTVQNGPASIKWFIENNVNEQLYYRVMDAQGKIVTGGALEILNGKSILELNHLKAGVYFYSLLNSKQQMNTGKFFIY